MKSFSILNCECMTRRMNSKGIMHTNDVFLHYCIYQAENENQSL